jgi:hypothetical protein
VRVLAAPDSRIVTVGSAAHRLRRRIEFDDLQAERNSSRGGYARSKLANRLLPTSCSCRLAANSTTISVAAHSGGSKTELARNSSAPVRAFNALLLQSAAIGALPALRAGTGPRVLGGQYFGPSGFLEARGYPKLVRSSAQSHDPDVQRRLWSISEELTGVTYRV